MSPYFHEAIKLWQLLKKNRNRTTPFQNGPCFCNNTGLLTGILLHCIDLMLMNILIADSGATKTEWCLLHENRKKTVITQGLSPYFVNTAEIVAILQKELLPKLKQQPVQEVHFFGTGCSNADNNRIVNNALKKLFPGAKTAVDHDMAGAARGLCHDQKGVACILGTGSSACFYNGKKIVKSRTGLGYALGDEGSGAYLGRKVIQYYLYDTFDEELKGIFDYTFHTDRVTILENVYKKPFPNRYLAGFAIFLAQNRGHFMVENIIEDGLNDFFFHHIVKFSECWKHPVYFVGGVAFGFKDVIKLLCNNYGLQCGKILQRPMDGLAAFY
jgi:glucosamine kinase